MKSQLQGGTLCKRHPSSLHTAARPEDSPPPRPPAHTRPPHPPLAQIRRPLPRTPAWPARQPARSPPKKKPQTPPHLHAYRYTATHHCTLLLTRSPASVCLPGLDWPAGLASPLALPPPARLRGPAHAPTAPFRRRSPSLRSASATAASLGRAGRPTSRLPAGYHRAAARRLTAPAASALPSLPPPALLQACRCPPPPNPTRPFWTQQPTNRPLHAGSRLLQRLAAVRCLADGPGLLAHIGLQVSQHKAAVAHRLLALQPAAVKGAHRARVEVLRGGGGGWVGDACGGLGVTGWVGGGAGKGRGGRSAAVVCVWWTGRGGRAGNQYAPSQAGQGAPQHPPMQRPPQHPQLPPLLPHTHTRSASPPAMG